MGYSSKVTVMTFTALCIRQRCRAALLVFAVLLLPGISVAADSDAALDRIVEQGVLRVAMSGNQQPFNFVYGRSASVVGFDVDLARELARSMNVDLELLTIPFNELLDAVDDGRADMAISGITITAARTRVVSFVGPYVLSGKSLLARGEASSRQTADFNRKDVELVALQGSTSESLVTEQLPEASLTPVENYDEAIKRLLAGEADGMVADMPILAFTRNRYRDAGLQLMTPPLSVEPMGIAIARGELQLENLLRNTMSTFEKTGLLMELYQRWFEVGGGELYRP
jgi:polar amino acid transport system substrate-binding protein